MSQTNESYEVKHTSQVKLLIGEDVFTVFKDKIFLDDWDNLYLSCPWATIFQAKDFSYAWYQLNKDKFIPILVLGYDQDRLDGLLALAIHRTKKKIVGAGQYDTEYQTWLAKEQVNNTFIKNALLEIRKNFTAFEIELRFIPANTPINWIKSDNEWNKRCILRKRKRPLMYTDNQAISKELKKKNRREKINRLNRIGNLSFERISDKNTFENIFDTIADQYDFRQVSKYNRTHFKGNPLKKELLMQLFNQNLLHVTILKLDDDIIASNVAVAGQHWVHLKGMNTWSPLYAKYSPGILHFLMLGQQLHSEGYTVFDLTPGDDPYKDTLANAHDEVYELWAYSKIRYYVQNYFRKEVYFNILKINGTTPLVFEGEIKKIYQKTKLKVKKILKHGIINKTRWNWLLPELNETIAEDFKVNTNQLVISEIEMTLQKNSLKDLLCYESNGNKMIFEYLMEANKKFESNQQCYTTVQHNKLVACIWFEKSSSEPNTIVLNDLYYQYGQEDCLYSFIVSTILNIAKETNLNELIISNTTNNKTINRILASIRIQ